ncbi:MAG: alpha/beta hydrolase [Chromatiales bacterium]|nr:alpha/beta hydrolase [Chromatiales bacterium]
MEELKVLLAELTAAVRAGDRELAMALQARILRHIADDAARQAEVELEVRALMAELDRPRPTPARRVELTLDKDARMGATAMRAPAFTDAPKGEVYPVWFGTNRKPNARGDGFTGERHTQTSHGRCDVFVPESHRFGETGSPFWKRLLRFTLKDDHLRVQATTALSREDWFAELNEILAEVPGEKHALLFLHGYNVSFEDAAIRAAQIGFDLKVPGATAFFSWPSRGATAAYPVDEASIEASEAAITAFLVDFCTRVGADRVHLIAHSMGNRGLLRALQRIAANAAQAAKVRFAQIILAAPDVDRDLFIDLAGVYGQFAERTTLYASDADLPVHVSAKLHDAPRAGYFTPYTVVPGVDTIAVPDFDLDLLGHSYFAQAEALLHDMFVLIRHGSAPGERQRLQSARHDGVHFWRVGR